MSGNPYRYYNIGAWGGMIMLPATILFWGVLGQNIPPYSAGMDIQAFADEIIAKADIIRVGMIGQLFVSSLYFVWGLTTSKVVEEVEEDNNYLSTLVMWGIGLTTIVFMLPCAAWLTVVFRPEQMDPRTLAMFYDFGWFFFDVTFSMTSIGMIAMGVGLLNDKREVPLFPSWVCWLSICVGIAFVLEVFMPLFKIGAFSRAGMINYYLEFTAFFIYWLATAVYLLRAVARLKREHSEARAAG